MILSFVSSPDSSPALIIASAARSLTEPPGFINSALAKISMLAGKFLVILRKLIKGVLPIADSRKFSVVGISEALVTAVFIITNYYKKKIGREFFLKSRPTEIILTIL